jgi:hypothetical protein
VAYLASVPESSKGTTVIRSAWKRSVIGGLIIAIALAGCTAQEPEEEVEEAAPVVEVPEAEEVVPDAPRHPLTGIEVQEGSVVGPVIMAKIDHENRPYLNLHRADIVWQQMIPETGTRFLAVWHSDMPEKVSYVRSLRPHDYSMASPFGGILASTGLAQVVVDFKEALDRAGVKNFVWDYRGFDGSADFWSTSAKPYSRASSVEFSARDAATRFSELAPPQQYFNYVSQVEETTATLKGDSLSELTVFFGATKTNNYTASKWVWNQSDGVFNKVFLNGDPVLSDSVQWTSGQTCGECVPLSATNIVVISVEHDAIVGQPTARFTTGATGPAWIATGGKILKVNWESGAVGVPLQFTDRDGEPVTLAPGKTWILVYPGDASTATGLTSKGWDGAGSIDIK